MNPTFTIIPLDIRAKGEITANNLPEFREMIREALAGINRDLSTDEEFGQAELDVKALKTAEDAVRAAALKACDDRIKQLVDDLNATAEEIRTPRLELEKLINARKDEVKAQLIEESLATFTALEINAGLARKTYLNGLQTAIKGKRTLESMRTALRVYATSQQGLIGKCRKVLDTFEAAHGTTMTMDRRTLELETPEGVDAELRRRFEAKRAADERKRLEEEAAKAKAEAQAAIRQAEVAKAPAPLPVPPKIGGIPTGANAAPPSNVVPMMPQSLPSEISEDMEWEQITATVKAAFALIKEHRARIIHPANESRIAAFGAMVNDSWKTINRVEVAS